DFLATVAAVATQVARASPAGAAASILRIFLLVSITISISAVRTTLRSSAWRLGPCQRQGPVSSARPRQGASFHARSNLHFYLPAPLEVGLLPSVAWSVWLSVFSLSFVLYVS